MKNRLLRYIRAGRVHPALVLAGPDREEKLAVAKELAKAMLCRDPGKTVPCGRCNSCRRVEKEIHPDVFFFREDEEDSIKIDAVRQLCLQMEPTSLEGGAKIAILDEAHRMTSGAANAFLKTLEEPGPERHFWLLTTQPGACLPTILSRCLLFTFPPAAVAATDEKRLAEFRRLFEEAARAGHPGPLIGGLDEKDECLRFLRFLQGELRAAAVAPHGDRPSLPAVAKLSPTAALGKFDEALALEGRLRSNASFSLLVEVFLRKEFFHGAA